MNTIPTVTIGIPAYNEEANIAHLLRDLSGQRENGFLIERILVMSDGSSDRTVAKIREVADTRLEVVDDTKRKGKALRQNDIIERVESDILILLDADILIEDSYFITKLIQPILRGEGDLVSGSLLEIQPKNVLEKILHISMEFKRLTFRMFRGGNNMYTCVGPVRALSKKLYQTIAFQPNIADDMYTYLFCMDRAFSFVFVPDAVAYYKLPETLADYCKQSFRYSDHLAQVEHAFDQKFIVAQTYIPSRLYLSAAGTTLIKHPLYFTGYLLLKIVTKVVSLFSQHTNQDAWEVAQSSKVLR